MSKAPKWSKYKTSYWCTHEGIWVPKKEAKKDKKGRPVCPYCLHCLRVVKRK